MRNSFISQVFLLSVLGLLTICTRFCYFMNTNPRSTSTQTSRILGLLPICFQCLGLDPICTRSYYELYQVQLQTCQPQILLLRPIRRRRENSPLRWKKKTRKGPVGRRKPFFCLPINEWKLFSNQDCYLMTSNHPSSSIFLVDYTNTNDYLAQKLLPLTLDKSITLG